MRKVLIIANLPHASPRISSIAKYLPEFGWQPIILTGVVREHLDSQVRIIKTPYNTVLEFWKRLLFRGDSNDLFVKDVRKQVKNELGITSQKSVIDYFLTICGEIFNYPDADKKWKSPALKAGSRLLQEEKVDAIISSSSPVTSHLIARELKIRHKIPWIADFRDLWTQNHNYGYGPLRKLIDKRLELKTLLPADALVTVSQPWADNLSVLHGGKTTYVITNGFDSAEMNTVRFNLTSKFTITYTGSIYQGKQDSSKLFAALLDLISDGTINPNEVEVRFYGSEEEWLTREIGEYGLSVIGKQYGTIPREDAFQKQRESQVLLLLNWEDYKERGVCPLKTFEYLAAMRPILATGGSGNDAIREILDETKAGIYASTVEEIKKALRDLYQEYKLRGETPYKGEETKINKYSYREKAKKFAEVLNNLI